MATFTTVPDIVDNAIIDLTAALGQQVLKSGSQAGTAATYPPGDTVNVELNGDEARAAQRLLQRLLILQRRLDKGAERTT